MFIVSHKSRINWHAIVLSVSVISLSILILDDFWISSIRFHAAYFVAGLFAATYFGRAFHINEKGLLLPVILLIAIILWYYLFCVASAKDTIPKYLYFLSRAFAAMFAIIAVWIVGTVFSRKIKSVLSYFGGYSLQIYLIHLLIIQFIVISPGYFSIAFWLGFLMSTSVIISVFSRRIGCSAILFGR